VQQDIERLRVVFEGLLTEYPLCFGYWSKWAAHEGNMGACWPRARGWPLARW
jgi:hypothetical protein